MEALDGGFAIDQDDDDLARFGMGLGAHDHQIVLADSRFDHRIAVDFEGKDLLAGELLAEVEATLDVFLSEERAAGGDAAEYGDGKEELGAKKFGPIAGGKAARFAGQFFEVAFCFQGVEVVAGGAGRAVAEFGAYFADSGW